MKRHELLGQLSGLHQMTAHLLESTPEEACYRPFHPDIPPLAWLLGRAAYVETWWLREVVQGDERMTARVRPVFGTETPAGEASRQPLPPREHLLNWALELHDENLTRLANPGLLPAHPLLADDRLLWLIVQEHARVYELMLAQLSERALQADYGDYRVGAPLRPLPPAIDHADLHKGHYRVGAKADPAALDNELPTQIVELHAFRIDRLPVRNGAFLGFIEAGGYEDPSWWDAAGDVWRRNHPHHPHHWRRDGAGNWFAIGLNGPFDLTAEDVVSGLSHHEALAYARWVSSLGGPLAGAVVQHEYQWEVAARTGAIGGFDTAWEWCANPFHAYTGYTAPEYTQAITRDFDAGHFSLRGACLHTQRVLRRASFRHHAPPGQRWRFSGTRLVFPPSDMPWHHK